MRTLIVLLAACALCAGCAHGPCASHGSPDRWSSTDPACVR